MSSRLFEPLGFISLIVIEPKILLQEIWQTGLNWDDALPQDLVKVWQNWINSLNALSDLRILRYYFKEQSGSLRLELHMFPTLVKERMVQLDISEAKTSTIYAE